MDNGKLPLRYIITDFFLVGFSFLIMNYFKQETFTFSAAYLKLFGLYYFTWAVASLFNKKFNRESYHSAYNVFTRIFLSTLYHLFLLVFILVIMNLFAFSRLYILGAYFILFLFELGLYMFYFLRYIKNGDKGLKLTCKNKIHASVMLLFGDFIIFLISIRLGYYFINSQFDLFPLTHQNALILSGLWFVIGMTTSKFDRERNGFTNLLYVIDPVLKSVLFILLSVSFLIFVIRLDISIKMLIPILLIYLFLDSLFYLILYKQQFFKKKEEVIEDSDNGQDLLEIEDSKLKNHSDYSSSNVDNQKLNKYDSRYHKLLSSIPNFNELLVEEENTPDLGSINSLPDQNIDAFLNLRRFNDINYINRFLLKLHDKLKPGGYFLGRVDTIIADKRKFKARYPHLLYFFLYPLHFFIFRIFPKLPLCKKIYSFITRGKRHIISKAEALGRLYYCGFKVLKLESTKDGFLFLSQKVKTPSRDPNPSYGPLIKLDRIGLDGEKIKLYKLRTMHPYSEYIQDYIYEAEGIKKSGKFKNDFRRTRWGTWFRRLWIDELPQLINWIKGDVTLVGVRALSEHYFNLYPKDLQQLRIQFKPGIIPPYYADMPGSFEEIIESERKYLLKKKKNRLATDFVYFFKVFNNIIFNNARSQ